MILSEAAKKYGLSFSEDKIHSAIDNAVKITNRNIIKFQDNLPAPMTTDGIYPYLRYLRAYTWEQGFWCGIAWLCHEITGDYKIKCYCEKIIEMFYKHIPKAGLSHNDLGFWIIPSCMPYYNLTKSIMVKELVADGANSMLTRYDSKNHILMSHDFEHDSNVLTLKISVINNAFLFNLAYLFTGSTKYKEAFLNNIKFVIDNNIAQNGETYFFSFFNAKTGLADKSVIPDYAQSENDSSKTRSYAWALHGLAQTYSMTGDKYYADKFHTVYSYLKSMGTIDRFFYVSVTDINSAKDSTSATVIVCALQEMLKNKKLSYEEVYARDAVYMLNELADNYAVRFTEGWEGLLKWSHIYRSDNEKLYSNLFGDYFYLEALINSIKERKSIWYDTGIL